MASYQIVEATPEHALELAENMNPPDAAEVWAAMHSTPLEALLRSMRVSRDTTTGLVDGRVLAMFGVAPTTALSTVGSPWLLGSREVPQHRRAFMLASREYIRQITPMYAMLENYVDARYTASIRWIRWLGFTVDEAKPFGLDGALFHRFWAMRNV